MNALLLLLLSVPAQSATFPPALPGGKTAVLESGQDLLRPPMGLASGVIVAKRPPSVELLYFPGQDYPGKPWSVWGESLFAEGKYYTAIGDHLAPEGNAFLYEYDPTSKKLKQIADLRKTLSLPRGHYSPGKIHTRIDRGSDGWLYFGTHRGSTRTTTDAHHYKGDWVMRHDPRTGKTEVVVQGPVPKHCIPVSITDPDRLIFYGSTQPGDNKGQPHFFALDLKSRKVLHSSDDGPKRAIALARSTGRIYYTRGSDEKLVRFDPSTGTSTLLDATIGIRAASPESKDGIVYTVSQGRKGEPSTLYAFDTRTEKARALGPAAVGSQEYITALALDPTGRYLYYAPGAHGGADRDGTPIVQFDTRTNKRKVIAFLSEVFGKKHGVIPRGTYALALDDRGERLFITWNASRGGRNWDICCLTVIHLPASERP